MKKRIIIIILVFALFSCSRNDVSGLIEVLKDSNVITQDEALSSLYGILEVIDGTGTKGGNSREIKDINVLRKADISLDTKSSETDIDNLVYLVNFTDDNGFAVLSADKRIGAQVIAVTEKGDISVEDFREDTEIGNGRDLEPEEFVAGQINSYISLSMMGAGGPRGPDPAEPETTGPDGGGAIPTPIPSKIGPLLTTKWSQVSPFNDLCPSTYGDTKAGCVAIAVGQIVNYHRHATNAVYDWDLIEDLGSISGDNEVAKLIYAIGKLCDMDYGEDASSSTPAKAKSCLEDMGYSNVKKYALYKEDKMLEMLRKENPVYIGAATQWIGGVGHDWVIDGYVRRSGEYLFHCNYGWGGKCDGHYYSEVFDLTQGPVEVEDNEDDTHRSSSHFKYHYRTLIYDKP